MNLNRLSFLANSTGALCWLGIAAIDLGWLPLGEAVKTGLVVTSLLILAGDIVLVWHIPLRAGRAARTLGILCAIGVAVLYQGWWQPGDGVMCALSVIGLCAVYESRPGRHHESF